MKLIAINLYSCILLSISAFGQISDQNCMRVSNDFASSPLQQILTQPDDIRKIWTGKTSLTKRTVKNVHSNLKDTLYTFHCGKSEITFYKGEKKSFLKAATVHNSEIHLSNEIKLGDNKKDVARKLKIDYDFNCDEIIITDEEDFTHHRLYFKSGKLSKVILDFGMD